MKKVLTLGPSLIALVALTGACAFQHQSNALAPSDTGGTSVPTVNAAAGTWSSQGADSLVPSSCSFFQWQITAQSNNSISGSFSATCTTSLGGVAIDGTASGQLNGNNVPMTASGVASLPGLPACNFTLTGTGTIDGDSLTIPYTGTTCLGAVHGTQVLRKKSPPPPPAPPPPPPPPSAPPDPLYGCGGLVGDKLALVTCIHDAVNPPPTVDGAFDVTKRVAWALRGEGAGLLVKTAGDNIVAWQGNSFSAGRIAYPGGHIFKILIDVPSTNAPQWTDNGFVSPSLYVPAIDPTR